MYMKTNLICSRTCVFNVNYNIVWSTKYRVKVLTPEIENYLQDLFKQIGIEKNFNIIQVKVGESDHVHIFVSAHPKISPSYIAKMLKGISARRLLLKYPIIKNQLRKGHLWNSSFYIETIGSISEDIIKKYIEKQLNRG